MGQITIQQAKVFTIFAVAFVMTGLCTAFARMADNTLSLMTGVFALVLTVMMFTETQKGR